jgi:protein sidekick
MSQSALKKCRKLKNNFLFPVLVAPDTPFIFPIPTEAIFERSVTIEWRINEHSTSPYRYFTLQFEVNNGGWLDYSSNLDAKLRKLKVEGLLPGTRYRFRIMATNDVGGSQYSSPSEEVTTNPTGERNMNLQR